MFLLTVYIKFLYIFCLHHQNTYTFLVTNFHCVSIYVYICYLSMLFVTFPILLVLNIHFSLCFILTCELSYTIHCIIFKINKYYYYYYCNRFSRVLEPSAYFVPTIYFSILHDFRIFCLWCSIVITARASPRIRVGDDTLAHSRRWHAAAGSTEPRRDAATHVGISRDRKSGGYPGLRRRRTGGCVFVSLASRSPVSHRASRRSHSEAAFGRSTPGGRKPAAGTRHQPPSRHHRISIKIER